MNGRRRNMLLALAFLTCVSCEGQEPTISTVSRAAATTTAPAGSSDLEHAETFDFGEISLDAGPRRLEHSFRLINQSGQTRRIEKIVTSCGCTSARASLETLEPRQAADLFVVVDQLITGRNEQTCQVVFADGGKSVFCIRATGTRSVNLAVIPARTRLIGKSRELRLVLQVTDRHGEGCMQPPTVLVGEQRMPVITDGWTTVERASDRLARPLRQIASVNVDLTTYQGPFPAELTVVACSGLRAIVTVEHFDG